MIEFTKMDCNHVPLNISDEHKANFLKLGDYIFSLPENYDHFDMTHFFSVVEEDKKATYGTAAFDENWDRKSIMLWENHFVEHMEECGTIACLLGHGPLAGIMPGEDEGWPQYSWNKFGVDWNSDIGGFFFAMAWRSVDNTPRGAAKRIYYALQHGVPRWNKWWLPERAMSQLHDPMTDVFTHLN